LSFSKNPERPEGAPGSSHFGGTLRRWLKSAPFLIGSAAVAIVLGMELASRHVPRLDFLKRIEWITYDWRMRQASRMQAETGTNFGFVFIGDEAIDVFSRGDLGPDFHFGLYWPRHIYGRLVQELSAEGAKAIGLDILFGELRPDHKTKLRDGTVVLSDAYLTNAMAQAGNVVLGATPEVMPHPIFRAAALSLGHISTRADADGVLRRVRVFLDHRIWHAEIVKQAQLNGWDLEKVQVSSNELVLIQGTKTNRVSLTEDGLFNPYELAGRKPPGGFVRLARAYEDLRVWHLGIALAAMELGADLSRAKVDLERGRITLSPTNGATRVLPVDGEGRLLIDWTMSLNDPRLTQEAFESVIDRGLLRELGTNIPARFKDKLVIVGSTAQGNELSDRGSTPLDKGTFLTSSHWNLMNSVITNRFVRMLPLWAELMLIAIWGAAGSVFTCKLSPQRAALTAAMLAAVYISSAVAAFIFARYWVPLVMPLIALALCYAALVTYQALFEQSEKRRVRGVFSRVVAPSVVEELLKAPNLALVGKRRCVTVMFADIRGFTVMTDESHERAEQIVEREGIEGPEAQKVFDGESEEVVGTVNQYLSAIADTIKKNGGTLDKYIGDCVMAFWGAPTDNDHHAVGCVQSAIEAQRAIKRLNEARRQENARRERANFERATLGQAPSRLRLLEVLSVGIGINTGTVDAGLMGSQDAQNYTIFGRDVNVASRLEKLAEGNKILIGESTFRWLSKQAPELAALCVELPPTAVRGIREAVKIYEVRWEELA
jgi:class 3 adenylate cyclase/CHASE2 domain-containing sensor protein